MGGGLLGFLGVWGGLGVVLFWGGGDLFGFLQGCELLGLGFLGGMGFGGGFWGSGGGWRFLDSFWIFFLYRQALHDHHRVHGEWRAG